MKHMFWKGICLVLMLAMLVSMSACGSRTEVVPTPEPTPELTPESTPEPTSEPTPEPTAMPTVQSVDIQYAGKKLEDFTMFIGETVPLKVAVLPADMPIEVTWSTDPDGESALKFNPSESDPAACEVVCVGPLPENSGGVRIYAQVYGGKAQCMVHVIGSESMAYTEDEQTVEIHYALNDKKLPDFTMKVGETVPLVAVPVKEDSTGTVVWSMDSDAEQALRFIENESDPNKVSLECFQALPANTGGVRIFAELDGVKTVCIVYVVLS